MKRFEIITQSKLFIHLYKLQWLIKFTIGYIILISYWNWYTKINTQITRIEVQWHVCPN